MLQFPVPCAVSRRRLWHLRRCVSPPPRLTNWHFLPLNLVITTLMRRSPAHPRSLAMPLALKPFLREARNTLRAIALRGDSLSVHAPPLLLPPGLPPPGLPPPGAAPRSTTAGRPTLPLSSTA